ncbi:MAG: T9SS type A sorting domain-containing protein [Bacteroidetes bacterium]|nr:T9SS type A sorting domain-containing protein [Bacteroidota bacterium]
MKNLTKNIFTAAVIFSISLILKAQPVPVPFDNAWYGFNTQLGSQPYFMDNGRLADIDNDGDSDVVGSRYFAGFMGTANGFAVLKNEGSGSFSSIPVYYSSPQSSEFVYSAKLNNDAFQDIIVSNTGNNFSGNSISVFMNQGNGSFGAPVNYFVGGGPVGIAADDFNGDNKTDIAVATCGSFGSGNTVTILINNGDGTFADPVLYPAGSAPYKLSAGKINPDNFIDLAVANENGKVNVLINTGTGNFSNRTEYSFTLSGTGYRPSIKLCDTDNDTDLDILYGNNGLGSAGPEIGLLRNTGGVFSAPETIPTTIFAGAIRDIEAADLNNDGWNDIVTANANARVTDGYQVLLSNGSGGFQTAFRNNAGQNTEDAMVGDIDNDGKTDILTADSYSMQVTVHKNLGQGVFPVANLFETGISIAGSLDASDIDNDGDLDVIISASGRAAVGVQVKVMKNTGNGIFGTPVSYTVRGGGVQAKFRNLNSDNFPDILYATAINSPPYDFHFAVNNGDGTFGPVQTKSIGACGWYDIDAADMDNDGDKDVVITEWLGCQGIPNSSRRIFICLNNGNAVFADPIIKVVGPNPAPIGTGDFNSDGKMDIVTGVSGAEIELSLGTGNGDLLPPVAFSIGSQGGATDISVADINNDGNLDVASSNFWESTTMSVLYGNGNGTFQSALILPSAYSPDLLNVSGITVGDLDNDGDKDIIVGNNASNCMSLYYNNNGTFEYKMRAGGYSGVYAPLFEDFDGDNKGDLIALGSKPPSGIESNLMFLKGRNTGVTSVSSIESHTATGYSLGQNYPNPFNPSTNLDFSISKPGFVSLKIYDVSGKEVAAVVNNDLNPGTYKYKFNASDLPSGIYFYTLTAHDFSQTKKMILLK